MSSEPYSMPQFAILGTTRSSPWRSGPAYAWGELVGLNVGDLYCPDGRVKARIRLRAEIAKGGSASDVFLPAALTRKLEAFRAYKLGRREPLDPISPLFCNQGRRRISRRRVQVLFRAWQVIAGFGRLYRFHALRHTAVTNVYRASRDLFLAQRFARHASPLTTTIYAHVSDEERFERLSGMES